MSGRFDFTGPFPRWEDADERLYENRRAERDFNAIVDRLMFEHGLDREEAELRAEQILMEDAA